MHEVILLGSVFAVVFLAGRYLIRGIPPLLHTPLMSLTNAVSGVTVVGAILLFRSPGSGMIEFLAALAVAAAAFNLVGGFVVTGRMLAMFRNPDTKPPKT